MSNDDRLAEIKRRSEAAVRNPYRSHEDIPWLIAEVEQLRDDLADAVESAVNIARQRDDLLASWRRLDVTHRGLLDEAARLRALVSWIDGACVDNEADVDMQIRAAINRYWESQK